MEYAVSYHANAFFFSASHLYLYNNKYLNIDVNKKFEHFKKWNQWALDKEKHPQNLRRPLWMGRPLTPKEDQFFINKEKVKLIKLPVHSKNPLIILFNSFASFFEVSFSIKGIKQVSIYV